MTELISIKEAPKHVGEEVKMHVWLTDKRSSGKIMFLQLRDGTAFFQGVLLKKDVPEEVFNAAKGLHQEASMYITGTINKDERSHFGYEIKISDLEIVTNNEGYPIGNKEHGIDFLLDHRHLWLRSKRPFAIMQIRNQAFKAIVDFFEQEGFVKFDAPILMQSAPEGTTELFHIDYFYTRRHLTEFWMMEPEMAWMSQDESLDIQERLLAFVTKRILDNCEYELRLLGRDPEKLRPTTEGNFPRLSYDEAVKMLQDAGRDFKWGDDFGAPDEAYISEQFDRPVFILNYPTSIKPFYMKKNPDNPKEYLCADVLAPEGYGEIIGGSERESDYETLRAQIKEAGLNEKDYEWYLDLRKYGSVPHSGFGIGFERYLGWICKLDHIREAVPFPRMINRLRP